MVYFHHGVRSKVCTLMTRWKQEISSGIYSMT
nr:MAG TPA: hypothetical protein [Caudoviricetes sp.]